MSHSLRENLNDFPELKIWFSKKEKPDASEICEFLIWQTCTLLEKNSYDSYLLWKTSFKLFIDNSISPLKDFLSVEYFFASYGLNISFLLSDIGMLAMKEDDGDDLGKITEKAADLTKMSSFRFLSAWIALNNNQLSKCIEECEKIDEPNHSVYTLLGQALLEQGRASEAVEELKISIKLCSDDEMTWFQLSKAYLVLDDFPNAWDSTIECMKIIPGNTETSLLLSMIALQMPKDLDKIQIAWKSLSPSLEINESCDSIIINLLDLAFISENKDWAENIIEKANFKSLKESPYFLKSLGSILRIFGELNWFDLSSEMLSHMSPEPNQVKVG